MLENTDTSLLPNGAIINGYRIINLICPGSSGGIYFVKEKKSSKTFVMKIESFDTKTTELPTEIKVLRELDCCVFPKLRDSGNNERYQDNFAVMNCLGLSLKEVQEFHGHRMNIELVYNLAIKMLQCIKALHTVGYIHCDIKPKNFLIQQNPKYPIVLIDFNMCQKFDVETGQNETVKRIKDFQGTTKYASINALLLQQPDRNDDLISWFYSFLDLVNGSLPWEDEDDLAKNVDMRRAFKIEDLTYKFPKEIQHLYDYLKTLRYDAKPDYKRILEFFEGAMKSEGFNVINPYDFTEFVNKHTNIIDYQEKRDKMMTQYEETKRRKLRLKEQKERQEKENQLDDDSDEKKKHHHKVKNIFKRKPKKWFY